MYNKKRQEVCIMNLEELNERQREAVLYNDGPLLIIAGAGAGKTKTLTTKIAYLIEKKNVAPENILAITFTNKAAKEMKDRLFKTIGQTAKYLEVSTFHSFGLKLLRENYDALGYDKNFVTIFVQSELPLVDEQGKLLIGKDYWDFVCNDKDGFNIVIEQYVRSFYLQSDHYNLFV